MKKILSIITLFVVVILCTTNVNAEPRTEFQQENGRPVVNAFKEWTIKLNGEFDENSLYEAVRVWNEYGEKIYVSSQKISRDSITVYPPQGGYAPGNYTLNIMGLKDISGGTLAFEYSMFFTVQGLDRAVYISETQDLNDIKAPVDDYYQPITNGATVINPNNGDVIGVAYVTKEDSEDGEYNIRIDNDVQVGDYTTVERIPEFDAEKLGIKVCGNYEISRERFSGAFPQIGTMFYKDNGDEIGVLSDVIYFNNYVRISISCPIPQSPVEPQHFYYDDDVEVSGEFTKIDGAKAHTVWIDNGDIYWTGGDGVNIKTTTPVKMDIYGEPIEVAANQYGFYYLRSDGSVGSYLEGEYSEIDDLQGIKHIAAGEGFVVALDSYGNVAVCGSSHRSVFGDGSPSGSFKYVKIDSRDLPPVKSVAANGHTICAVTHNGDLFMWGANESRFIPENKNDVTLPVKIDIPEPVKQASCDYYGVMALTETGKLYGWGTNTLKLGKTPTLISDLGDNFVKFAYENAHLLALRNDGRVFSMGSNEFGQLGNGAFGNLINLNNLYIMNFQGAKIVDIGVGERSSYAMDEAGNLHVTGYGYDGQLGFGARGQNARVSLPVILKY